MSLEKFKLLCWKNFTLQKRHPIAGLFEILFPILIVLLFTFARNNVDRENYPEIIFTEFMPNDYNYCSFSSDSIRTVGISPSTNPALMELVKSAEISKKWEVRFFENAATLNDWLHNENETVAGVEFEESIAVSSNIWIHTAEYNDIYFDYCRSQMNFPRNFITQFDCLTILRLTPG